MFGVAGNRSSDIDRLGAVHMLSQGLALVSSFTCLSISASFLSMFAGPRGQT